MKDSIFCDKVFRIAFAVSLVSHVTVLLKPANFCFTSTNNPMEVTYLEQKTSTDSLTTSDATSLKPETKKKSLELKVAKSYLKTKEKIKTIKDKVVAEAKEKKIVVKKTNENFQKKKNVLSQAPEFYIYYQYLRKRIKEAISYPQHFQEGEVLVNFTLFSNGTLKEVSVADNLSAANAYLRYAAIQSVKDASPFKPFPKELIVKEIPFQIFISFEFLN